VPPAPEAGTVNPIVDGGVDAENDDVIVKQTMRYGFATGNVTDVPVPFGDVSAAAIVTVDGKRQTFPGTVRDESTIVIPGVPSGPYVLEIRRLEPGARPGDPPLVRQYPIDGARTVRVGTNYWPRNDTVLMTPATKVALSITTPATFVEGDTFSWIGLRSYLFLRATFNAAAPDPPEGHANVPAAGSTSSTGWTIAADALEIPYGVEATGLPMASAGDDLLVYQSRSTKVTRPGDRFAPWSSFEKTEAVGVLAVPNPDFTKDTTNTVTGTLTAPPTESVSIDFRGSSFSAIREAAKYPKTVRASAGLRLVHEAGTGPGYFASVAPESWSLVVSAKPNPVHPECFPEGSETRCSQADCPVPCAEAFDGFVDPGDLTYTFDAPRIYTAGMQDLYSVSYTFSLQWRGPNGQTVSLSAGVNDTRPKQGTSLASALELGPVRNLRINGAELPWENAEVSGGTATLAFDPPAVGTPEYYEIVVLELLPDLGADAGPSRPWRDAARLYTRATSIEIPSGVLRSDHYYSIRVRATRDGTDFSEPFNAKSDTQTRTGIFSPPFYVN